MEQYCAKLDEQLQIISLDQADPEGVLEFFKRTDKEFYDLTPERSESFYTKAFWNFEVDLASNRFLNHKKASFVILNCKNAQNKEVIGWINFNNVIHGAFKACYLGYVLDKPYHGKNIMYRSLAMVIPFMMEAFQLNRIMANYMPENKPSERLLMRLGFEKEGYAKRYLKLGGKWRDHVMTAYIDKKTVVE